MLSQREGGWLNTPVVTVDVVCCSIERLITLNIHIFQMPMLIIEWTTGQLSHERIPDLHLHPCVSALQGCRARMLGVELVHPTMHKQSALAWATHFPY